MEDPKAASLGGMGNRQRNGINDVGWGIIPSNYERYVHQLNADETSQVWWNLDESIYGRFALFGDDGNKMLFKINDQFLKSTQNLVVTITYLDKGHGAWTIGRNGF